MLLLFLWWATGDGTVDNSIRDEPASFSMRPKHDDWLTKPAKKLVDDADIAQSSFCPIANSVELENYTSAHITNLTTGVPFDIYLRKEGDLVSSHILRYGSWEPDLVAGCIHRLSTVAKRKSQRNSVLLDIGSNIGFFAFAAAAAGHHTIAIEMMGQNQAALMKSFCKNRNLMDRIRILPFGLGAKGRSVCLAYAADFNLLNGIIKCNADGNGDVKALADDLPKEFVVLGETVVVTLDELLPVIPELWDVGVVKMDTEGFESHVMKGSREFFRQVTPPYVMTEISNYMSRRANANPRDVLVDFDSYGYNIHANSWDGPIISNKASNPTPPQGYVSSAPKQEWDGFEEYLHGIGESLAEIFLIHKSIEGVRVSSQSQ
ncbi:hypothetical protein SeLEV6574_g02685 [Synchytrium endobioticum]|nr:hypothetical protein SeLEV6574_g02685 [Synchytrium endobioticum]